jgi:acetyl-CoA carboxylase carboxyl transferase subunit alpha
LGIGVGDHLAMLQYSTYFVISPEGCANIIWKSSEFAPDAAAAMGVTSSTLQELGIVDATIPEPMGGAHRNLPEMARRIREHVAEQIDKLVAMDADTMLEARYTRLMSYGN